MGRPFRAGTETGDLPAEPTRSFKICPNEPFAKILEWFNSPVSMEDVYLCKPLANFRRSTRDITVVWAFCKSLMTRIGSLSVVNYPLSISATFARGSNKSDIADSPVEVGYSACQKESS
jgi:hypothetical protein